MFCNKERKNQQSYDVRYFFLVIHTAHSYAVTLLLVTLSTCLERQDPAVQSAPRFIVLSFETRLREILKYIQRNHNYVLLAIIN